MSRQGNTNVTTSAISRSEKVLISELLVINETDALKKTVSRQNASFVWRYFGALHRTSTSESDGSTLIDGERLYCRLCLEREKQRYAAYASSSAGGHISRVKSYGKSSTTTLREHLEIEHKVTEEDLQSGTNSSKVKQTKLTFKRKLTNFEPFSTQYEMNRDLVVWAALDIEPFMFTEKPGLRYFFEKNYPSLPLPSRATLSRGALYDVYDAVTGKVKDDLAVLQGGAVCIMMDGWTDRYKRYPYLGLRVGYINSDWEHKVATISLKVLEKHTGENMSAHIREELKAFGLDLPSMFVFTTHDGAANMVKASSLLRSAHFQHCVGHSLHLLIMTDGVNRIPELVELLKRCKAAVIRLDAKCYVVEDKQAKKKDREVMDDLLDKITRVKEVIQADEDILLGYPDSDDDSAVEAENNADSPLREKKHKTLKQSGITRWNSTLTMIESTLCLWNEMNEALKANGDREYCLLEDDRLILSELQQFLRPFQELTDLVSAEQAHLGLIPLIVREVKDASKHVFGESDCMRKLKNAVEQSLPRRIKISEAVKIATLLDPCAKHLLAGEMTSDECKKLLGDHTKAAVERMEAVKYSNRESSERASNEEVSTSSHAEVAGATGPPASKKMKLLQKFKAQGHVDDKSHQIEAEVNNYVHLQVTEEDENPLTFWRRQRSHFPYLSTLAKNYLTISASSVPVESMFSTCGLMLNVKRSSMAAYRANILTVIHDNYEKYFPITRSAASSMQSVESMC